MHFAFTEDQRMFRDALRDMLVHECPPEKVRAAWESEAGRVPGLWRHLAAMGVVGLTAPEEAGGLGLDALDLALLVEEAGRAALPEPLLETTAVAIPLLRGLGDHPVARRWLPAAAQGEAVLAVGLPGQPLVAWAAEADLLLLAHDGEVHAVPRADVDVAPERSVDRSRRLGRVRWAPSAATRLLAGDAAAAALDRAWDRGALAASCALLGLGARMLEVAVDYAKVREQFGRPIGAFQALQHQLADALLSLELARPVVYRAAWTLATGAPGASLHVSMAKAYASDAATRVARTALQVHGAIGYAWEYDLHLWMKRAWALAATWGDAAWHRARVGRVLLDDPSPTPGEWE